MLYDSLFGSFVTDEDRAQGEDSLGSSLSHTEYRVLILTETAKNTRGKKPSTKDFVEAKRKVDSALGRNKTRIKIPGAQPGRRTI